MLAACSRVPIATVSTATSDTDVNCHHYGQHSTQTVPTPTVNTINTAHKLFLPPSSVLSTQHTNCSYPHRQYYQHSTQTVPTPTVSTINTTHKLFLPSPSVLSTQHTNCSYPHRQHCNVGHRGCHHDCQHSTQTVPTPTVSIVNIAHKLFLPQPSALQRGTQTVPTPIVRIVNIAHKLHGHTSYKLWAPPSALQSRTQRLPP